MICEIEVVINNNYGGFRINHEMLEWLVQNRGWKEIPENKFNFAKRHELPITTLIRSSGDLAYSWHDDKFALRSHPDLIDCVRALKEKYKNDNYVEKRERHIHNLKIVKVEIYANIEDYNDGHERVNVWTNNE